MGSSSSFKKDTNVDIYMQVTKDVYIAGEMVQGIVHLNIKSDSQYDALYIRLEGKEYCHWSQGQDESERQYSNQRDSYIDQFILNRFDGVVPKGQYSFPFSFVLPASFSGSFYASGDNYIRYPLTAYLSSFKKKHDNQMFVVNLNVDQPLRHPFGQIQTMNSVTSKCCGCCYNYGTTTVSLSSNKNYLVNGDQVGLNISIDNTVGNSQISNFYVNLVQSRLMVQINGYSTSEKVSFPLYNFKQANPTRKIQKYQIQNFAINFQIPKNINDSTGRGNITALIYYLQVLCQEGCCNYSPPTATLQVLFHSRSRAVQMKQAVSPPPDWRPLLAAPVIYTQMKPYIYQPVAIIANINSLEVKPNKNNNMGVMPNFNSKQSSQAYLSNLPQQKYGYGEQQIKY